MGKTYNTSHILYKLDHGILKNVEGVPFSGECKSHHTFHELIVPVPFFLRDAHC